MQREALDVPIEGVKSVVGGDHGAMRRQKRQADDVAAAENEFGFGLRREANDSALASERCGDVEIAAAIEGEALWTSEAAEKRGDFAGGMKFYRRGRSWRWWGR